MPTIYNAILRAGQLEWLGDKPPGDDLKLQVTVVEPKTPDIHAAVAALRALADSGGPTSFGDPSEWQREIRQDKPLHGRDE
ncbi:MAG: hypothetical protein ACRC8S_07020 [Fimbriiglobus sp.]